MGIYHRKMWQAVENKLGINESLQCYYHSLCLETLLHHCSAPSPDQRVVGASIVTDADFTGWRQDYFGPSPCEVSQGSRGEACRVHLERTSPSALGMITVRSAWSLSSLPTWRDLCPAGKEDSGQFHHLLVFSTLRASIRSAFQQIWLLSEKWGAHLKNCDKNDLRIWKESWQALSTRLATKVSNVM